MGNLKRMVLLVFMLAITGGVAHAQRAEQPQFGPVVQAYLGYLRNEQEVVDDRASRHEISSEYYRRNSNRIRALRQMAIRLVTKSANDYVPELEAVAGDEMRILFEDPPSPRTLRVSQVVKNTFRYLGPVSSGEVFYLFARLDPYEQAALIESGNPDGPMSSSSPEASAAKGQRVGDISTRPRRSGPR